MDEAGPVFLVLSGDWYGKGYEIRVEPAMPCTADYDCTQSYPETLCDTTTGACYAPLACAAGTADCDANPDDGCETDTTKDTANCGACGVSCQGPNVKSGTCAASSCALTCDTGYADCDEHPTNGCETYLLGDGANCGACGHDCMHGGCAASICTAPPVALGTTSTVAPNGPVALDATSVYVAGELTQNMGGVISVPRSGGAATLLVNDDCNVASLVVDATTVYWAGRDCNTVDAAIKSAPVAGGATTVLASDQVYEPAGLLADATTLYWYDAVIEAILSLPKAGGEPSILVGVQKNGGAAEILGLAADATTLYFTTADDIANTWESPPSPSPAARPRPSRRSRRGPPGSSRFSGTDLYVATDTNIAHISTTGGSLTPFTSANLGSADPSFTPAVTSMAIAGGNLYWSAGATSAIALCPTPGGIWRIPLAGGPAVGLASDESPGPIAADASGVYMSATCSGAVALHAGP